MSEYTDAEVRAVFRQAMLQATPGPTQQEKEESRERLLAFMASRATIRPVTTSAGSGERPLNEVNFLTVAEVAALMRVSRMTVYRLVHTSQLPAVRVGRSFRVPEQAVHDFMRDTDKAEHPLS